MPGFLAFLSAAGTAAMIWVGGGIIVHGLETYGLRAVGDAIHAMAEAAGHAVPPAASVAEWVVTAAGFGTVGLVIGQPPYRSPDSSSRRHGGCSSACWGTRADCLTTRLRHALLHAAVLRQQRGARDRPAAACITAQCRSAAARSRTSRAEVTSPAPRRWACGSAGPRSRPTAATDRQSCAIWMHQRSRCRRVGRIAQAR